MGGAPHRRSGGACDRLPGLRSGRPAWFARSLAPALCVAVSVTAIGCGKSLEQRRREAIAEQRAAGDAEFGYRPLTEVERIEALLGELAAADLKFERNGRLMSASAAANILRRQYERHGDRISSAEQFVAMLGTRARVTGRPYVVHLEDGSVQTSQAWLLGRLEHIGGLANAPTSAGSGASAGLAASADGADATGAGAGGPAISAPLAAGADPVLPADVQAALADIETSTATFVLPHVGKYDRPDRTGREFARILRRKTSWIGADIPSTAVASWLHEIAARDFKSLDPYRVREGDHEEDLEPWLCRRWGLPEPQPKKRPQRRR